MLKDKIGTVKRFIIRMNRKILSVPIWIVIGISGFQKKYGSGDWKKSSKNEKYGKLY